MFGGRSKAAADAPTGPQMQKKISAKLVDAKPVGKEVQSRTQFSTLCDSSCNSKREPGCLEVQNTELVCYLECSDCTGNQEVHDSRCSVHV